MNIIKYKKDETLKNMFLENMGISSLDQVNEWYKRGMSFEYRIDKLKETAEFITGYKDQPVVICGDYDVDGITSTAILYLTLTRLGFKNVSYMIPKRFTEGFGINKRMIDEAETGLIITCDNGVAQTEEVLYAKEKGFAVVIIDHHLPKTEGDIVMLPKADFIIDPNAIEGSADFNGYCGAGLCYRLAAHMLNDQNMVRKMLSIAAIGTVGDMMELKEENYYIVRQGIKCLKNAGTTTTGIRALLYKTNCLEHLTSTDLSFTICPCIGSVSRLKDEGAMIAVKCLIYMSDNDMTDGIVSATELTEYNNTRKELKREACEKALRVIKEENMENDCPIVVYIPGIKEGLIGLVAADIVGVYNVPTIVLTDSSEKNICKGSSRSVPGYHIKNKLDEVQELIVKHGGHEGAAGLSVEKDKVDALRDALNKNAAFTPEEDETMYIDIEAEEAGDAISEMEKYEPYGKANPTPCYIIKDNGFNKNNIRLLKGGTLKLESKNLDVIGFGMAGMADHIQNHEVSFIGNLSNNYYNGNVKKQMMLRNII